MIQAIIIDDEPDSIETCKSLIKLYNIDVDIIASCGTVKDGIELIQNKKPDLVFLDVQLGSELGFDVLEGLPDIDFQVIFISAHHQYAFKAFKYSAVDYLLKPIDGEELENAVNRIISKKTNKSDILQQMKALLQNMNAPRPFLLAVPESDGVEYINIEEIIDIEAEGSYAVISFRGKGSRLFSKSLGELQEQLPEDEFCRVHNSHIINLKHVKKLKRKGGLEVEMQNSKTIPVARNRREFLQQQLKKYLYSAG